MDEKYEKNIKWLRIGAYLLGGGFLISAAAVMILSKDIFGMILHALLGLSCMLGLIGIASKMEHDLEKEKKEENLADPEEHDIGF